MDVATIPTFAKVHSMRVEHASNGRRSAIPPATDHRLARLAAAAAKLGEQLGAAAEPGYLSSVTVATVREAIRSFGGRWATIAQVQAQTVYAKPTVSIALAVLRDSPGEHVECKRIPSPHGGKSMLMYRFTAATTGRPLCGSIDSAADGITLSAKEDVSSGRHSRRKATARRCLDGTAGHSGTQEAARPHAGGNAGRAQPQRREVQVKASP